MPPVGQALSGCGELVIIDFEFNTRKSIFFEEYSGKETLSELKKKFFDWLVAHVFKRGRSVEWYEVFFQTYGNGFF